MKSWAQGLKQWGLWFLGEGPLPDTRSRKILAGTLAGVAVLIAAGVLLVGGSSTPTTTSQPSTNLATAAGADAAGSDDSSDDSSDSGSGGSGTTSSGNTKSGHSGHSSRTGSHSHTRTPRTSGKSDHTKTTHTLPSTGTAAGGTQNYLPAIGLLLLAAVLLDRIRGGDSYEGRKTWRAGAATG